jgi:hypothetical protein
MKKLSVMQKFFASTFFIVMSLVATSAYSQSLEEQLYWGNKINITLPDTPNQTYQQISLHPQSVVTVPVGVNITTSQIQGGKVILLGNNNITVGQINGNGTIEVGTYSNFILSGSINGGTLNFLGYNTVVTNNIFGGTIKMNGNVCLRVNGQIGGTFIGTNSSNIVNYDIPSNWGFTPTPSPNVTYSNNNTASCPPYVQKCAVTTTWNGSSWNNGAPNDGNKKVVIAGNYNTGTHGSIDACTLVVNGSANLTVATNTSVLLQSDVKINGNVTVENGGSFVQVEESGLAEITGTGTFNMKRKTTPIKQYDYTYWSSPVQQAPVNCTSLYGPSIFYTYNPATGWVWTNDNATVPAGKGFITMAPEQLTYNPTQIVEVTFSGRPNTGTITTPVGVGSNLLGNPYPSAIDADKFIIANPNLKGTIYLWTHNTAMQYTCNGCASSYYTANDYAAYNLTGSVRTSPNGTLPTGKIAAGQGFFVEAVSAGNVKFDNKLRVAAAGQNMNFYRPGANTNEKMSSSDDEEIVKSRMWFTLTNTEGAYAQALLGHITGASDGLDNGFDGELMDGGNFVTLYTILGDKKLSIQGRSANFNQDQVIPVGYKSTMGGELTIAIEDVDGLFGEQSVFLVDNETGSITNLKEGAYTFTSAPGSYNNRFRLTFSNTTLGTDLPVLQKNDIAVIRNAGQVQVRSNVENLASVIIYDLTGREIAVANNINSSEYASGNLNGGQVVLVKVITEDNRQLVQKVILN